MSFPSIGRGEGPARRERDEPLAEAPTLYLFKVSGHTASRDGYLFKVSGHTASRDGPARASFEYRLSRAGDPHFHRGQEG
jgi:hypothetical protein